jgi:hypothetical protein
MFHHGSDARAAFSSHFIITRKYRALLGTTTMASVNVANNVLY